MQRHPGRTRISITTAVLIPLAVLPAQAWHSHTPFPTGSTINAVWAPAVDHVYAGGEGGTLLRWDGSGWEWVNTATNMTIYDIHGTSETDIWAVGGNFDADLSDRSLILHYDGNSWVHHTAPTDTFGQTFPIESVHAIAYDDVWATGASYAFIYHWDGQSWTMSIPPVSVEGNFNDVWAAGPDNVFFAGTHGQILHLDHGVWRLEQKLQEGDFTTNILTQVWGLDLNTVYAGGNWGQVYRREANGTWTDMEFPSDISSDNTVNFLGGTSPTNIYIVGNHGVRTFDGDASLVRHDLTASIRSQWFCATTVGDRLYMGGRAGVVHEYIPEGPGSGTLSPMTVGQSIYTVAQPRLEPTGPDQFLIYGHTYNQNQWPLWYFDGTLPHQFPSIPSAMANNTWIKGAVANGPDDIIVSWAGISGSGLSRWNGSQWGDAGNEGSDRPYYAEALWKAPSGNVYAATQQSVHYMDTAGNWHTILPSLTLGNEVNILKLGGRSDSEVYMITRNWESEEYGIYHYIGSGWTAESVPDPSAEISIIATCGSGAYAFGPNGLALMRNGSSWTQHAAITPRNGDDFWDAVSDGGNALFVSQQTNPGYVGGGRGILWRFEGTQAARVIDLASSPLQALCRTDEGNIWGIDGQDTIISSGLTPDNFHFARLDLSQTGWQKLGNTGIEVWSNGTSTSRPAVAAWTRSGAPTLFDEYQADPHIIPGNQQWFIHYDVTNQGAALPPSAYRFFPNAPGYDMSRAKLYGREASRTDPDTFTWNMFPTTWDAAMQALVVETPSRVQCWTFAVPPGAYEELANDILHDDVTTEDDTNTDGIVDVADVIREVMPLGPSPSIGSMRRTIIN
ncbi:WD40 repeat domain-containing protein [bacterium]|nr:WD40 repeat domain-containing protein [bacterium]